MAHVTIRIVAALMLAGVVTACNTEPATSGSVEGVVTEATETSVTVQPLQGDGPEETFLNESDKAVLHLITHKNQGWPVRVRWEMRDGEKVAHTIEDL